MHPRKLARKLSSLWQLLELDGVGHHDIEVRPCCGVLVYVATEVVLVAETEIPIYTTL